MFFIPDMRTHSFAFPYVTEEDNNGNQIVTYPPALTRGLFPELGDSFEKPTTTRNGFTALNSVDTAKRSRDPELTTARGKQVRRKPN